MLVSNASWKQQPYLCNFCWTLNLILHWIVNFRLLLGMQILLLHISAWGIVALIWKASVMVSFLWTICTIWMFTNYWILHHLRWFLNMLGLRHPTCNGIFWYYVWGNCSDCLWALNIYWPESEFFFPGCSNGCSTKTSLSIYTSN